MGGWLFYLALEPYGRQVWPSMFISSSRLLSRPTVRWRDPLIGRSVLAGLLVASLMQLLLGPTYRWLDGLVTGTVERPWLRDVDVLIGQRAALAWVTWTAFWGLLGGVVLLLTMVTVRYFVRSTTIAVPIGMLIWTFFVEFSSVGEFVWALIFSAALLAVLLRLGAVALIVTFATWNLAGYAITPSWTAWYAQASVYALLAVVALAAYGYWASTPGRRFHPEPAGGN